MILSTRTRAQGGSLATSIPAEVSRRMALKPGTELFWVADGEGGYRVVPGGDKTRRLIEAHEEAITEYREVFQELAK